MLSILSHLVNLIDNHVIWLYVACLVVILLHVNTYVRARRERNNTPFTIEKEVAVHREGRAMTGIGVMLGIVVLVTAVKFYVMPTVDLSALMESTPTVTLPIPTLAGPTPTPTEVTPTGPTVTPRPTVETPTAQPTATEPAVTPTRAPAPVVCADPNTAITSPGMDATVSGVVAVVGTAGHPQFQFYKVEYAVGAEPGAWNVIGDVRRTPVAGGELARMDTRALPNGPVWFQVTVVDQTGNFPTPCRVRVNVQN